MAENLFSGSWPLERIEIQTKKCKKCYSQMSLHLTAEVTRAFQAVKGKDSLPHLQGAANWSAVPLEKENGGLVQTLKSNSSHFAKGLGSLENISLDQSAFLVSCFFRD